MPREVEKSYVIWQNRAYRFYLASRILVEKEQYAPAAFCSIQALESLMKATLVYWDKSFKPEAVNHRIACMIRTIRNKAEKGGKFSCPEYFYRDKRFQSVTRYPANGKGVLVPSTFLNDLDEVFSELITLVPFHFNTKLIHALSGDTKGTLLIS